MAPEFGDSFTIYPWNSTAATTIQYGYSSGGYSAPVQPTYYYPPTPASAVEMPEGPLDWLRRRVVEITDLAYAT